MRYLPTFVSADSDPDSDPDLVAGLLVQSFPSIGWPP